MGVRGRLQDRLHWRDSDIRPASYGSRWSRSGSRKSYNVAKAESDPNDTSVAQCEGSWRGKFDCSDGAACKLEASRLTITKQ